MQCVKCTFDQPSKVHFMNCLCPEPIGHRDAPQDVEWRRVADLQAFWISSMGDVWSPVCGLMSQHTNGSGMFKAVAFMWQRRLYRRYVHRLVANAFLPDPAPGRHVRFIDGDKWNCQSTNLRWHVPPTEQERWQKYKATSGRGVSAPL